MQRSSQRAAVATVASCASLLGLFYYLDLPKLLRSQAESRKVEPRCLSKDSKPSLQDFKTITNRTTLKETYPFASEVSENIPIYDCHDFDLSNNDRIDELQDEFYHILTSGPGVFGLKHLFTDLSTIDSANQAHFAIIQHELNTHGAKGDHFAPASANSRIWNSFSKHALQAPSSFFNYFSNPWFRIVSESYLGPAYRLTSQVNIVRPGGKAQMPHRDYHLGFQADGDVVRWPKVVHKMSQYLTLQGAVAHTDMPLESGPTRMLPWSHLFEPGYMCFRSPEFVEYFESNYVALPLEKGDAIFFNPALLHAAGENVTKEFERSANLIQVSSAFAKPMETIDTLPLVEATYDPLTKKYRAEGMSREVDAFVAAVAEGYPFPTNLDRRPPSSGMAPESAQDILRRGLTEGWDKQKLMRELRDLTEANSAQERPAL